MNIRNICFLLFAALSPNLNAQTFTGSNFGAIPDGAGPGPANYGSPLDVQFNVTGTTGTVSTVSVSFGAAHPWVGDLKVSLISPTGTSHLLFERTGAVTSNDSGSSSNLVATNTYAFADSSSTNWWTAAGNSGLDIPSGDARTVISGGAGVTNPPAVTSINTAFVGTPANGTWRLRFEDGWIGDPGSVAAASLTLTTVGITRIVNSTADTTDGTCDASNCTLREAIASAQNGDLINFSTLFNTPQNIDLTSALPAITRSIAIQGPGAQLLTVRRAFTAASDFRVFDIPGGVTNGVAISGMTISNGRTTNFGGGILSRSRLSLSGVHIAGNTATLGGGVFLGDTGGAFSASTLSGNLSTGDGGGLFFEGNNGDLLMVANSTVSGNHSAGNSGGIRTTRGQLQLTNSTVVGNTASSSPGGVLAIAQTAGNTSTITLRSTIVSSNTPNNFAAVAVGGTASIQTQDFNLSDNYNSVFTPLASDITSVTPRLAPLALYGGTTPTHALLTGSPALDAGDASGHLLDQRSVARVFGNSADIGAVEMRPLVVLNFNDNGPDSLRELITAANSDNQLDDIVFSGFFNTQRTITLTSGQLPISSPINIIAPGANLLTVSGNNASRVFALTSTATATLSGLTITGGNDNDGGGIRTEGRLSVSHAAITGNTASKFGGGIYGVFGARTSIERSTISGNTANAGGTSGGIEHSGTLTVSDSTISGNITPDGDVNGGGLWIGGVAQIVNSNIVNNTAAGATSASGVFVRSGASIASLRNSIVAGNNNNATLPDLAVGSAGSFVSHGFNLIGNPGTVSTFNQTGDQVGNSSTPLNPVLGPLANNGGSTLTHALLAGSPALDKGERSGANTDQRGSRRPFDLASITNIADGTDIGALERALGLPPTLAYAPSAGSTIGYSASGTAAPIVVTPSGGSSPLNPPATNTTLGCGITNGGAAFPTTSTPSLEFVGDTLVPQNLNLPNCVPQAGLAVNATLACLELRGSDALIERQWTLVCPAGTPNTPPSLTYNPLPSTSAAPPGGPFSSVPHGASSNINVTCASPSPDGTACGGSGTGDPATARLQNVAVAYIGPPINPTPSNLSCVFANQTNATVPSPLNFVATRADPGNVRCTCGNNPTANDNYRVSVQEVIPVGATPVTRNFDLSCTSPALGPNLAYAPGAGASAGTGGPVNFTGVTTIGSTGNGPISVTPSGGASSGTTTLGSFTVSGTNASAFTVTSSTLTFTAGNNTAQNLNLTCVSTVAAQTANLQATETIIGGATSQRFWVLNCPAGAPVGFVVTNTNDSGSGSLRQAMLDANNNGPGTDDISFSSLFNSAQTITLSSELVALSDMTILGPSSALLSLSGNNLVRVLRVDSGVVNVTGITFTRGNSGALPGGAIRIDGGEVTLLECQITDSRASDGAGILNDGSLTLERVLISGNSTTAANEPNVGAAIASGGTLFVGNSTLSGNSAQASTRAAGAVLIYGGTASINNSTITNNSATNASTRIGGILPFAGTLTLRSSIVAGNINNATIPDVGGTMTASFNVIGNAGTATGLTGNSNQIGTGASPLNPLLGLLSNNGGSSLTHALNAGSPALDAGSNVLARTRDQRGAGFARVVDLAAANVSDGTDVGALEMQTEPLAESIFRNGFE